MLSKELVNNTIQLNHTDSIPIDLHNFTVSAEQLGKSYSTIFHSGELMAKAQIEQWEKYDHDMLLLENGTAALAEALGCNIVFPKDSPPRLNGPAITRLSDISSLPKPDPTTEGTLPELLKATRLVKNELSDQFIMGRGDQGPFSLASMVLGMERFLMELSKGDNLDKLEELLSHCREVIETFIRAQLEVGADGSSIGDSIAGPDVCHPKFYRQFALPQEKKLMENLKKDYSKPISLHICGNATEIVPDMMRSGAEILELDYKIDQKKVRGFVEGKVSFLGPLDPVLLGQASPKKVRKRTNKLLSIWGNHQGLIFGPGCAMNAKTPEENIKAMINTVRNYTPKGDDH